MLLGAAVFVYQVRVRLRVVRGTSPNPHPHPHPNPNPNPNPNPIQRRAAAQRSPEQLAQSVTDGHASGGGADKKLSVVAVHLDRDTALPQPPDFPDEKPTTEGAAPPQSLPALLAACGLEHHRSAFEAERYTLENLLSVMKQGDEAAIRDLRELKLNLEECRKFITQLKKTSWV